MSLHLICVLISGLVIWQPKQIKIREHSKWGQRATRSTPVFGDVPSGLSYRKSGAVPTYGD
jgi:hypothetical protein